MSRSLSTLLRSCVVLALSAVLIGCEQTAAPVAAADTPVGNGVISTAAAALHASQQTTGGAVDGSRLAKAPSVGLDNVPNMGQARQQMILAGFRLQATINGQDLYSAAARSVFAPISVGTDRPRCAIGRDGPRGVAPKLDVTQSCPAA